MFRSLIIVLIATSSIGSGIHAMSVSLSAQQCLIRNIIEEKRGTWTEAHAAAYYGFDDLLLEALNSTDPSVRTIDDYPSFIWRSREGICQQRAF